ncbi:formate/nitrite transporter family protein [Wukongibacter baidiensis]|uniref:formate/nitrite transporter family protein n=1 Tax=Wukongibacter baidiensis TaxID=1723361 RepID=UPI003D7F7228
MYSDLVNKVSNSAIAKVDTLKRSRAQYIISSILAGIYVGFGVFLIMSIGGSLQGAPTTKVIMGASFGVALSLVVMAGSELFTGNNFVMVVGAMEKKVSWLDSLKIWMYSFTGNFAGSILIAFLYFRTGLAKGAVADFIVKVSSAKMNAPTMELFFRGILCNILVCLAVLCYIKLKDETAKLIMIFWCLFAFITSGFEHSIANMSLLTMGLFLPHDSAVSLAGMAHNLIPVTIGNFIGGGLFLGLAYWYKGHKRQES